MGNISCIIRGVDGFSLSSNITPGTGYESDIFCFANSPAALIFHDNVSSGLRMIHEIQETVDQSVGFTQLFNIITDYVKEHYPQEGICFFGCGYDENSSVILGTTFGNDYSINRFNDLVLAEADPFFHALRNLITDKYSVSSISNNLLLSEIWFTKALSLNKRLAYRSCHAMIDSTAKHVGNDEAQALRKRAVEFHNNVKIKCADLFLEG